MGSRMSKPKGENTRLPRPPAEDNSNHENGTRSEAEEQGATVREADLSSYESACRDDPELRSLDAALQQRTSRAINSIAVGLDVGVFSLDALQDVTDFLLEMNQDVVNIILQSKEDVWKNPELFDLVNDYFENSLKSLDFCAALEACLKRAHHSQSIIRLALKTFDQENTKAAEEGCSSNPFSKTLEELRKFRAAGDPFTQEFFSIFQAVRDQQLLLLEKLQAKRRRLDKKLSRVKGWRKVCNTIFVVAFVSVLICSIVAAAATATAPPILAALAAAASVPLGSVGKWLDYIWRKWQKELSGEREIIFSMQFGSYIVIKDIENIRVLVDKLQIKMEGLQQNADFALGEDEAVVIAVDEIKKQVDGFMKTIQDLINHADKCSRDIHRTRTVVLRRVVNYPSGSNQDIGVFFS